MSAGFPGGDVVVVGRMKVERFPSVVPRDGAIPASDLK
jgi:hypothetical protein